MSGWAYFLNGAAQGLETGMDLREKYDIYKERQAKRADEKAVREKGKPQPQAAAALVAPPATTVRNVGTDSLARRGIMDPNDPIPSAVVSRRGVFSGRGAYDNYQQDPYI